MSSVAQKGKEEKLRSILCDPVLFSNRILGHTLSAPQEKILRSVAAYKRTAVKACHASGKTFTAADLAIWWITHRKNGIVITTAPTKIQVERVLWGKIRDAVQTAKIDYPEPALTSLKLSPTRYAIGISTNESERFQGFHGDVLIIVDEAPGVRPQIYEAIEGIRAGGDVRVLMLGNPTIASGPFYDAFTAQRENWNLISISAFDTPNLEGLTLESLLELPDSELDNNPFPFLTTRGWVKEKYQDWGPLHPLWHARVLGNFPAQSEDALLSLEWLEQAKYREGGDYGAFHAGIDVGGPGEDETVLCVRQGHRIVNFRAWSKPDPRGELVSALNCYKNQLETVNVDSVGVGYHLASHLEDLRFPVRQINVGERSSEPEKYINLKAEIFWDFRTRAESGELSGLTDERAIAQLTGIRYRHNSLGKVEIESKEQARKRGVKSPDRAEAVILAFAKDSYVEPRIRSLW